MDRRLTKNEKKRLKKKADKGRAATDVDSQATSAATSSVKDGEVEEYDVQTQALDVETMADMSEDYKNVMAKFCGEGGHATATAAGAGQSDAQQHGHNGEGNGGQDGGLSHRKIKTAARMDVAELKRLTAHPQLVESHDVNASDPVFLVHLKSTRNAVPLPRHWSAIRKYLMGKVGHDRPKFELPSFISDTGISKVRDAILEAEAVVDPKDKKAARKPKMGRVDMDYQVLHDAFFKYQERPTLCGHGDLYYEGKEFESRGETKGFKAGTLSPALKVALDLPERGNVPSPWLTNMQRYGPPPGHPGLKIPGLNCPIPAGASFGYGPNCWGKPPVDAEGVPLYGPVFEKSSSRTMEEGDELVDLTRWGEFSEAMMASGDGGDDDESDAGLGEGVEVSGEGPDGADGHEESAADASKKVAEPALGQDLLEGTASVQALEDTVTDLRKRKASAPAAAGPAPAEVLVPVAAAETAAHVEPEKPAKRARKVSNFKF